MLARRELSTAQLRERLERKGAFEAPEIEHTLGRLQREGALNDRRTAVVHARHSAEIKLHGRLRATRELQRRGISRGLAAEAVAEVYDELDEGTVLERALARRLTGRIETRAELGRLYRYLIRQGFEGAAVMAALTACASADARLR